MEVDQDAFGHEVYDCLGGQSNYEVLERDDGYIDVSGPVSGYLSPYEDWSPLEREAMEYVEGRVLDIGCGAGRHSLYLQGKEFDVLGVDVSPLALKVCKLRGLNKTRLLSITRLSARLGTFDTILMLGGDFGLFGNLTRARWLLRRFRKMTSAQARIIAGSRDVSWPSRTR